MTAVVAISGLLIGGALVVIGAVNKTNEPITAGMTVIGGSLGLFQAHGRQQQPQFPQRRKTEPGVQLKPPL